MSIFPECLTVRTAIVCCLLLLQGNLLWLATNHQHPFAEVAGGASPAISEGSLLPCPALASELSCGLCQMVRQSLGPPVAGSPVVFAAQFVSRPSLFREGGYYSRQSIVLQGRAPPLFQPA